MSLDPRILLPLLKQSNLNTKRGRANFLRKVFTLVVALVLLCLGYVTTGLCYQILDGLISAPGVMAVLDRFEM